MYVNKRVELAQWGIALQKMYVLLSVHILCHFPSARDVVMKLVDELEEERWLDLQTRAVFVELCLYNPNTNLFTFLRMGAEFPVLGAASVWRDFKTLRLYQHQGALGAFVFVSELAVLLFVLVFTVRIALTIKSQKCAFFTDAWQVCRACFELWKSGTGLRGSPVQEYSN